MGATKYLLLCAFILPFPLGALVEETPHSVEEVEVLANRGDWTEAILRLGEVPAANRGPGWEPLVERVALGHVATLNQEGMSGADEVADKLLEQFPSLRRSKSFMVQRRALAFSAFESCLENVKDPESCTRRLFESVKADRADTVAVLEAAGVVEKGHGVCAALVFVDLAVDTRDRASPCGREETRRLVLAGLGLPAGESRQLAVKIARDRCLPQLKGPLTAALAKSPSPRLREALCAVVGCPAPTRPPK